MENSFRCAMPPLFSAGDKLAASDPVHGQWQPDWSDFQGWVVGLEEITFYPFELNTIIFVTNKSFLEQALSNINPFENYPHCENDIIKWKTRISYSWHRSPLFYIFIIIVY